MKPVRSIVVTTESTAGPRREALFRASTHGSDLPSSTRSIHPFRLERPVRGAYSRHPGRSLRSLDEDVGGNVRRLPPLSAV
ncbi:hypothetical protein EA473_04130 [Natrarchaeobius chitinivorans]|uniref:Uncharacterized protein n=1 Tax=Natrarchaeobius chitinivorans TaxID=1679083 RepID=A0A3N6M1R0_NATCH|nr:hypothetical protein EA473_04130 [Natrarchaeobius chitinivorans]